MNEQSYEYSASLTPQTTLAPSLTENDSNLASDMLAQITKYTVKDILILEEVAARAEANNQDGTGRCATALASLCFSAIEMLGLLIEPFEDVDQVVRAILRGNQDSADCFFTFVNQQGYLAQPITIEEVHAVYKLYRNKITHNLFPRHELGVCINKTNPVNALVIPIGTSMSLNVNCLSSLVKKVINELTSVVNDSTYKSALKDTITKNIDYLNQAEKEVLVITYNKFQDLRPTLSSWLPEFDFTQAH